MIGPVVVDDTPFTNLFLFVYGGVVGLPFVSFVPMLAPADPPPMPGFSIDGDLLFILDAFFRC